MRLGARIFHFGDFGHLMQLPLKIETSLKPNHPPTLRPVTDHHSDSLGAFPVQNDPWNSSVRHLTAFKIRALAHTQNPIIFPGPQSLPRNRPLHIQDSCNCPRTQRISTTKTNDTSTLCLSLRLQKQDTTPIRAWNRRRQTPDAIRARLWSPSKASPRLRLVINVTPPRGLKLVKQLPGKGLAMLATTASSKNPRYELRRTT
jgi:hypothetical protein